MLWLVGKVVVSLRETPARSRSERTTLPLGGRAKRLFAWRELTAPRLLAIVITEYGLPCLPLRPRPLTRPTGPAGDDSRQSGSPGRNGLPTPRQTETAVVDDHSLEALQHACGATGPLRLGLQ